MASGYFGSNYFGSHYFGSHYWRPSSAVSGKNISGKKRLYDLVMREVLAIERKQRERTLLQDREGLLQFTLAEKIIRDREEWIKKRQFQENSMLAIILEEST